MCDVNKYVVNSPFYQSYSPIDPFSKGSFLSVIFPCACACVRVCVCVCVCVCVAEWVCST